MKWESMGFMYEGLERASNPLFEKFIDTFGFNQYMWDPCPRNFKKFIYGDRSYNAGTGLDELPPEKRSRLCI